MYAHERASAEARQFCLDHPEFGYKWDDDRNCLDVGPRGSNGESVGYKDNALRTEGRLSRPWSFDTSDTASYYGVEGYPVYSSVSSTNRQIEASTLVVEVLDRMKPAQAEVLRLRYFHGMSQQEIAEDWGITQQAVSLRLDTAHRNFKKVSGRADLVDWYESPEEAVEDDGVPGYSTGRRPSPRMRKTSSDPRSHG